MNKSYVLYLFTAFFLLFAKLSMGQVVIVPANGGTSICLGSTVTLSSDIIIKETINNDIPDGSPTYTFNVPANFEFDVTASLAYSSSPTISGVTVNSFTTSALTITFNVIGSGGQNTDHLNLGGVKIKAITAPAFGNITSSANTLGVNSSTNHATLFSVAAPNVSISTDDADNIACSGTPVNFTGYGADTYEFFIDGTTRQGPSSMATFSHTWVAATTHSVYVKGTSNGCTTQSSSLNFTVNTTPTLNWNPSSTSFALNDADNTLNFNGPPSGSPGGGTLVFTGPGVSYTGVNYDYSPSAAGLGTHAVVGTYTVGTCPSAPVSRNFTVGSANAISGLNPSYCTNGSSTFLSINTPGKTLNKFQFYCYFCGGPVQDVVPANTFDPVYISGQAGATYIAVQALFTDGTTSPISLTYIYNPPIVSIQAVPNMCVEGAPYTLSLSPYDDGDAATYVDGASGVNEVSPQVWQFNPASVGPQTITYHYKDIYTGCSNNYTAPTFQVYPKPTPAITNTFSPGGYCPNSSLVPLTGSPSGGSFSGPGIWYIGFNSYYFYPAIATVGSTNRIKYTYSDGNGCAGVDSADILVSPSPDVSIRKIKSDTSECVNSGGTGTIKIEASRSGQCTGVIWTAYDGSSYTSGGNAGNFGFAAPSGGSFNEAINFTNSLYQAGNGYALIQVTTTGQPAACFASVYSGYPVYLIPPPDIKITGLTKDKFCSTEPNISLTATATYKYSNGTFSLLTGSDASNNNIIITPVNPSPNPGLLGKVFVPGQAFIGANKINYAYTDPNGCSNNIDTTLTINKSPIARFVIDSGHCATQATHFNGDTSFVPPSTSLAYTWDFGDGTTLADTSHLDKPSYTYLFPGGYPVSLRVVSSEGCFDDTILSGANLLTIQSIPVADYLSRYVCFGDSTNFKDLSSNASGALKSRSWIFSDSHNTPFDTLIYTSTFNPKYKFIKPETYNVTLVDSTTLGCTNRKTKTIFILPYFTPTATAPYSIDFKDSTGHWAASAAPTSLNNSSSWVHAIPDPATKPNMYYGGLGITDSVWVTSKVGNYYEGEKSHLYSPCFNFSVLDKPMISIKLWTSTQDQISGSALDYSVDDDSSWNTIGVQGDGINWYNTIGIAGSPGKVNTNDGWSGVDTAWRVAKIGLTNLANYSPTKRVRFRIALGAPLDTTISTYEGTAVDSVWIGNRNKIVLMEHFTNYNTTNGTTIAAIASADATVNSIRDNRRGDMAAIYYHTSFPAQDAFNISYPAGPSSRVLSYGVTATPRTVLDGNYYNGNVYTGSTPDKRLDIKDVDARALETAIFQLNMTTSFTAGLAKVDTKITYTGSTPVLKDVVLQTVITEDDSSGATKYGSVARQMLPDAAGSYYSQVWTFGDTVAVSNLWANSLPATAKLGAVCFIQDANSKEVYQAAYLKGSGSYGNPVITAVAEELEEEFNVTMFPNPATDEVFFLYGKSLRETSDWIVYDNMGRVVEQGVCSVGKKGFSLNTSLYAAGIYHVRLKGEKGAYEHKELVVIH